MPRISSLALLATCALAAFPAAAQEQSALNGMVAFTLPDGWERLDVDQSEVWLSQRDGDMTRPQARLMIRALDLRPGALTSHAASVLSLETPPEAQTLGELPVWRMRGEAAHGAAPRGVWYADTVVTQVCTPDGGPVALTLIDSSDNAVTDLLTTMGLSLSGDMVGCGSDALAEEVLAMIAAGTEAQANRPLEPFALVAAPSDWVQHERFGVTFRTPAGLAVRRDRAEAQELDYWLQDGEDDTPGMDVALRILSLDGGGPLGPMAARSPELLAALSGFAEVPMDNTGQQIDLGGRALDIYRGTGSDAQGLRGQVLFAMAETVGDDGYRPAFALRTRGFEDETGFTILNQVMSSLSATDLPIGLSRRISIYDGRGTLRAPSIAGQIDMVVREVNEDEPGLNVIFGPADGATPRLSLTVTLAEPDDTAAQQGIVERFAQNAQAETALLPVGSVWLLRSETDARDVVDIAFQQCIDGQLVVATLHEMGGDLPFDMGLYFTETDFLSINPSLALTDCIDAAPATQTTATAPTGGGKDPVAAGPSADTLAWEQALAADTPEAVIDYLTRFPAGAHSMDAQAWLTAFAEAEAARAAAAAQAAMAQAAGGVLANLGDDETLGRAAMADGSPAALWTYLKAYPDGWLAGEARAMLAGEIPGGGGAASK